MPFHNRKLSVHLIKAQELLEAISGKALTVHERFKKAEELAAFLLKDANRNLTWKQRRHQRELARMMRDPRGKAFTIAMVDRSFRSRSSKRVASLITYLLNTYGIPRYLSYFKQAQLSLFQMAGRPFALFFAPLARWNVRHQTKTVILPGEKGPLLRHLTRRKKEEVDLNLNHLGEAILGEDEAKRRLDVYLEDLKQEEIEYISIKISTIFSQINLLSWEKTVEVLAERLRELYRTAKGHSFTRATGEKVAKFVNLDMEEFKDLHLTVAVFKKVLSEAEFKDFSAGIVLQAYLPDSYEIQKEITAWAMHRVKQKGAPIKLRIVKGANLAMEQVEAALKLWPQAPYPNKIEVDANYKRMVTYGCIPDHARAVHLGIASHNLFDIAYALLLRMENGVEREVSFEMLEGMADHIRKSIQIFTGSVLLYCPIAAKSDFQNAVGYLIRRLDENTGVENFLRDSFGLKVHSPEWDHQVELFRQACDEMHSVSTDTRRTQNRNLPPKHLSLREVFENEADTDFSLLENQRWVEKIGQEWKEKELGPIPCVIGGREMHQIEPQGKGIDPAFPEATRYKYSLADERHAEEALSVAKKTEKKWQEVSVEDRCKLLARCAQKLREKRDDLIGAMLVDGGKTPFESDPEISEAIDFADYYLRSMKKMDACKDIVWSAKGTVLVATPWNFPISIPAGGILAALAAGNCVIFKPAPEAVLCGWVLVQILWEAGVSKDVLQFIVCEDDPVGTKLIQDERIDMVVLTGSTQTAKLFWKLRPGLDLAAETGGKNGLIITAMADRDLAIRDLIQSAFGHSGQKCSAASLAVLEAEVYDDPQFLRQLKDAVESLPVGPAWDFSSKVVPLIGAPSPHLLRAFSSLDEGESWLAAPKQDRRNPHLYSPGVKLGVREGSFMHQTELFGPVLAVMRADNLDHAIRIVNGTAYGLTSGIHSLDPREIERWAERIEAGNLYVNRGITGAIVRRQPFGGRKGSSFGKGAKAGGPNYVAQFVLPTQIELPTDKAALGKNLDSLAPFIEKFKFSGEQLGLWYASLASYSFWAKRFSHDHDPSKLLGQDNVQRYVPYRAIVYRILPEDEPLDILRVLAAAWVCKSPLEASFSKEVGSINPLDLWRSAFPACTLTAESNSHFEERVRKGAFKRVRLLQAPSEELKVVAAAAACHLDHAPVLANGRFELLHYLHELAVSIDYHRYGNLGAREGELRKSVNV